MKYLLDVADKDNHFTARLDELLKKYPSVDLNALGFPADWLNEPFVADRNRSLDWLEVNHLF